MNEMEWLTCTDPRVLLNFIRPTASPRKLRLFACACVRAVWHLLIDERTQHAVEVAERFADGLADRDELAVAEAAAFDVVIQADFRQTASDAVWAAMRGAARVPTHDAYGAAIGAAFTTALSAAPWSYNASGSVVHHGDTQAKTQARRAQCDLLREIVGNPFQRPGRILPYWLRWNDEIVSRLAIHIYEQRRFDDLPILGDALEEAGCADEALLTHCRRAGGHVRGCWVLDLLLSEPRTK